MNKPFREYDLDGSNSTGTSAADDFCPLEERILFDGAAAAEALDVVQDHAGDDAAENEALLRHEREQAGEALASAVSEVPETFGAEIFFIDAGIDDSDDLISAISDGAEVVLLEAETDGVVQIASVLQSRTDVTAIHILSHGEPGQINLGNAQLDEASISGKHADALSAIGNALSEDADILIYGCDFGQDQTALIALANATSADVAVSSDKTGAAELGGDWQLEVTHGAIETETLVASEFDGLLAAPTLTVPAQDLAVSEDNVLTITDVSVSDNDGDPLSVTLDVTNGTITLAQTTNLTVSGDGSGSVTLSGDAADINDALSGMTYSPASDFNGADALAIEVNDGGPAVNESVGIQIASVNDDPSLSPVNAAANESATITLTAANFGLNDPDLDVTSNTNPQLPKQIVFKLVDGSLTSNGTLQLSGAPLLAGSTFSLQDILDGKLTYTHDGSDVALGDSDSFAVTVNDGGGAGDLGPTNIAIDLFPLNQTPTIGGAPSVFEGQGTEDEFGTPGTITEAADIGDSLSISDRDDAAANSTITITNIDNAGEGTLFWDANGDGRLDPGEALTGGETFDADELANGRLRFAHNGDEVDGTNPSFDIEVTDDGGGAGTPLSSGPTTINIAVEPNDDNPDLATNTGLTVPSGGSATITSADLESTDPDTADQSIVYVVTEIPTKGELRINGEIVGVGTRFTQADIDNGLLDYNSTSAVTDGETDTFKFEVRDSTQRAFNNPGLEGADRNPDGTVTEHTFTITLSGTLLTGTDPGDPAPGRSGVVEILDPSTNTGIVVTEGDGAAGGADTAVISSVELSTVLQTNDGNGGTLAVPPEETVYRITSAPGNGTLLLSGTALGNYDTFTQADIDAGNLSFVHDGSENHQDEFAFSVTGGTAAEFDGTFSLRAIPINDTPSVATNDLPLLPEGATTRVTTAFIGLGDADTNDESGEGGGVNDPNNEAVSDNLWFRVTDLPDNGTLERFDGANWLAVATDDLLHSSLLTASADGQTSGLRYTHDGSENHSDSFSVQVRDDLPPLTDPSDPFEVLSESGEGPAAGGNLSGIGTVNAVFAPQNDAPITPQNQAGADSTIEDANGVFQTTANDTLFLEEGDTAEIGTSLLRAVDPDNTDPETLQYRITAAPANGVLSLGGSILGPGSTFTQADIDNGLLSYTHDGSESFSDQFEFVVSDSVADHVYSDADGAPSGVSIFSIEIDGGRNDPPEVSNGGAETIDLFGTFTHDFGTDLTLADPDIDDGNVDTGTGEVDFLQVTVVLKDSVGSNVDLSTSGGITLGSTGGLTQTDADDDDGDLVFQGSFADVQAALTNLQVELPNQDFNDTFTLEVTVDDRLRDAGGALTGGANGDDDGTENADDTPINEANNTDSVSVTFRASDDNDDPTATAVPGDQEVNEDTVLDLSGYVIDDVDAFDSDLTVDLAVTNGHLSVTGNATTSDASTLTLTGTLSEINAQLANLTYIANADFHSRDGVTSDLVNDDTLTITVNDGGSNGTGGGADVSLTSTNIAINPVNDAPTLSVPGTQTLASGGSIAFSGASAPTVSDPRDVDNSQPFTDQHRVTVSVPSGTGTLDGSGTTTLTDQDAAAETLVLVGTLADINSELDGLVFTPSDPNVDGTVTITVLFEDLANGGTTLADGVGGNLSVTDSFVVQISGVNNGPSVNTLTNQSVDEDSSLTFSSGIGNAFSISDPDDFGADMEVTVSVDHGIVTVASGSGATVSDDGTATVTITGTESEINAALEGLVYTPIADFHTDGVVGDTITVTIDDLGNTGTGGAISSTETAEITVVPVNDRPTATGGPEDVAVVGEDQTGAGVTLVSLLGGNYSDATDDQTPDGGDSSTAFSFVAITGSTDYDPAQGTWQVSDGSGGWIDVPASGLDDDNALVVDVAREIRFVPAADFHGTPGTLQVRLADGDAIDTITASTGAGDLKDLSSEGGTDQTGRWSAGTVTIQTSVANENDPPSGSDATLAAIDEDDTTAGGDSVANLFSSVFSDATDDQSGITGGGDASTTLGGIAVIGSSADAATEGTWQYSTNGGGSWTDIPQSADDDSSAILLPDDALLRFVPVADFNGTPGSLSVRLADAVQTFNASSDISAVVGDDPSRDTDIWSAPINLNTSITPRNDAPVLTAAVTSAAVSESTSPNTGTNPTAFILGAGVSDLDIATTAALGQFGAGTITVSMDDGGQSFDQLTISNASLPGIASVSGGSNGSDLVIDLLPTATAAQVEVLVEALRYSSSSDTFSGTRDITVTLSDGNNENGGGNDAGGPAPLTDTLSASVTITEQNDPPDASDNTVTTNEDTSYTFSAADFNFIQPGGETDAMDGVRIDTLPGSGTLELNGIAITADDFIAQSDIDAGNLTYEPPADQNGAGLTDFTFSVRDDRGAFDTAPNTMTINVDPVDDGVADSFSTAEDTPLSADVSTNDTHGAGASYSLNTDAANGSVAMAPDGTFTYTPDPDYNGPDSFTYDVTDVNGDTETVTVDLTVTPVDDIADDSDSTAEDTPVTTDVLGNDNFEGTPVVSVAPGDGPANGSVAINPDGTITYTPDPDFNGTDSYTYTVTAGGVTETATVTVTVDPVDDGVADSFSTAEDTPLSADVSTNDTHGAGASYSLNTDAANGSVAMAPDGTFTYTPDPDYNGPDSFTYDVTDVNGDTETVTVDLTVTPVDDIADDSDSTAEDTPVTTDVLGNDNFEGTPVVSVAPGDGPANGSVAINPDGTITYTPDPDFNGTDSYTYTVTAGGVTETATVTVTVDPVDDGVADSFSTAEDTPLSADVSTNDTHGANASYALNTDAANGTVVMAPDGTFTYTPDPDYNGPDSFTYDVTDVNGDTETVTVDLTVTPVDDIADDSDSTAEDTPVTTDVLGNDNFEGTPVVSVAPGDGPANGSVAINPDGTITYTPDPDFNGTDSYTYTVTAGGVTETATVTVTVDPVDDGVADSFSTAEDTPLSADVSTNDTHGAGASYSLNTDAANGTVVMAPDGTFTYTPDPDYNGPDSFTYDVTDVNGDTETVTVDLTVTPVDDIADDSDSTAEDTPVTTDVLGNDNFEGTPVVSVAPGDGPANGSVAINPDGTIIYTPDPDFNGTDSYTYTVTAGGVTETATVTVTVDPVDDGVADSFSTAEDTPLSADVSTNDTHGAGASYSLNTDAANGSVAMAPDGTFTYTPDPDYNGPDSFTYDVTDVNGDTETVTVDLTVTPVDDIADDSDSTAEDTPVTTDVLGNDNFEGTPVVSVAPGDGPANGSVAINPDGTITYTPDPDFNGTDSYTYTVTAGGVTETATVTVTVDPVDDGVADSFSTAEDTPLSADVSTNDTHGAGASYSLNTDAANGTVVMAPDGTFTYTPDPDYNGPDSFTYDVTDVNGDTETVTVDLTVTPVDDIADDSDSTAEDTPVTTDVLGNDNFEGTPVVSVAPGDGPANGSVAINPDGTIIYTPDPDFNGTDSYTYTVTAGGVTETATVTVTVDPVDDGVADSFSTAEDTPLSADVSTNDTHGAGASYSLNTDAANGSVAMAPDGTFTYTPDPDYNGPDSFTYDVTDVNGDTETVTVDLTVTPVDDIADDSDSTAEDTPVTTDVLGNDNFEGTPVVSVAPGDGPANGSVAINPDGTIIYTPDPDFNGTDSYTYTVTAGGVTETATVTVTVDPVDDGVADSFSTAEDTPLSADVSTNDTHGAGASYSLNTDAANGTVVMAPDGTFTYTPDPDYNGPDSFTYDVTDVNGDTETVTVDLTVTPVDDIADDSDSTAEDTPVTTDVLGNDNFEGTPVVSVAPGDGPANGSVAINPDGTIIYTPDPDFNGTDSYTYTVTAGGVTETATVTVTVDPVDDGVADSFSTAEDTPLSADVSTNDTHGAGASYSLNTDAANGSVAMAPDGTFTYTPDPDYNGPDSFTYDVTDVNGDTETVTVDLTVTPVDDIADDSDSTAEDTPVTTDVLGNDNFEGTPVVSVAPGDGPANGSVAINPDGTIIYTPDPDFNGTDSYTYTVTAGGVTETATVTVTVDPVDDGVADSFSTAEDTPLSADVSTNDTHGAGASYSLNTDAANGSVAMAPDGTFTYTPDPDYNGPDSFTYDVTDVNGDTETVTVDLTVTPVDDALVITGLTDGAVAGTDGSVDEGDLADGTTPGGDGETVTGAFTVSVADGIGTLEVGGTTLTGTELLGLGATPVTVATPLGALTLTGFDPETGAVSYSYTLSGAADHSGGAVTEDIALVLTDGDGDTAAGTLSVAVLDDAPVANAEIDEAISTPGNPSSVAQGNVVTGVDGSAEPNTTDGVADVLGADGAAAGGPVTGVVFGTGTPAAGDVGASVDGDHGTLVLEADGSYSYTPDYADPAVAALGPGDSLTEVFTYEITDADGGTATATLSVTILGTPAIAGLNDGTVPGSDGTVLESDLADGSNAVGTGDVLAGSFQAIAPEGVVSVTVGGTVLTAAQLEALTPAAPAVIVTPLGTLTLTGYDPSTGAIDYVYTLADDVDHSGGDVTDDIAVSVTDALGDTGTGTLSVAVLDDAPVAVDDTASLGEDDAAPVTGNVVTGNDVLGADETPSPVTGVVAGTGTPAGNVGTGVVGSYGTVTLNADGSYAYTLDTTDPAVQGLQAGETLTEVFTYEITDADGDTATATLTLTVTGSNDAPMAVADSATTPEDTPVTGTLLGNDSDADGDPLEVTQVLVDLDGDGTPDVLPLGTATPLSDAAGDPIGTLTVNPDGSFTFVPAPNYDGPVPQASYTITDGNGGTATSTLDITITPVDDAPVAGQPISPSGRGTEFPDDPWTERVPLIVDHIVGETANAESSLNSTPDLLSGVNTDLAVTHPILTALNGLQDLGGIEQLGTVSPEYFGGVDAGGPIQQAVRGIGFEPLADRFELFNRDFPDGAANVGELVTRSGFFIRLAVAVGRLEPGLVAEAWTPSGDAMPVRNMILEPDQDDNFDAESAEFSGGVLSVRIELETGQDIKLDVQLAQEAGYNVICWAKETETETFAEQTERFAKFGEYETARLMQALRGS